MEWQYRDLCDILESIKRREIENIERINKLENESKIKQDKEGNEPFWKYNFSINPFKTLTVMAIDEVLSRLHDYELNVRLKRFATANEKPVVVLPYNFGQQVWTLLGVKDEARISERIISSMTIFENGRIQLCLLDPKAYRGEPSETGYENFVCLNADSKNLFSSLEEAEETLRKELCR